MDCSNTTIDNLPPEMLQAIYKLLPFRDLLSCRLINSTWKAAATDVVRKRGSPIPLREFPKRKRRKILEKLNASVQNAGVDFPVDKFLLLNSNDAWVQKCDNVASMFEFVRSVAAFVTELSLYFELGGFPIQKARSVTFEEFSKLKFMELRVMQNHPGKGDFENEDELTLGLVKNIVEKSPKLKNISLVLPWNAEEMNTIPRCVEGLGIGANLKLLTSLAFRARFTNADAYHWQVVSGMGLKLKDLNVRVSVNAGYQQDCLKGFLKSQAETLTTLIIGTDFRDTNIILHTRTIISVEFPFLPKLKTLKIIRGQRKEIRLSNLCYKSQLPELKELCIYRTPFEGCNEFINNQTEECFEKLKKLTLSEKVFSPAAIIKIARFFPNIRILGIRSEWKSVRAVYEYMPQLEELCLFIRNSNQCLDDVITGLDATGNLLKYLKDPAPCFSWNRTIQYLETGVGARTMASLENLKILRIDRHKKDWKRSPDFKEISGYVLKKMTNLEFIDFGVRNFGPHLNLFRRIYFIRQSRLKEDLNKHFALVLKPAPQRRFKTAWISHEPDSEDNSETGSIGSSLAVQASSNSDHSGTD